MLFLSWLFTAMPALFDLNPFNIKSYAILFELTGWHMKGVKTTPIGAFQQTLTSLTMPTKKILS
jgi:hypothetical protein